MAGHLELRMLCGGREEALELGVKRRESLGRFI